MRLSRVCGLPILLVVSLSFAPSLRAEARRISADGEVKRIEYLRTLTDTVKTKGDHCSEVFDLYTHLAKLDRAANDYDEAAKYYQLAYDVAKTIYGERSEEVAETLNNLGETRFSQGQIAEASSLFHRALTIYESNGDTGSAAIAPVMNNLGVVLEATGNLSKAEAMIRAAIAIYESYPGANLRGFGAALSNLARLMEDTGNLAEATVAAQKALSVLEHSGTSSTYVVGLITLARLQFDQNEIAEAETTFQRALRNVEEQGGEDNPLVGVILTHLGTIYGLTRRDQDAELSFKRAIEIDQRVLGRQHPNLLAVMKSYAAFLRKNKKSKEARKLDAYVRDQSEQYRRENLFGQVIDVRTLLQERKP